MVQARRVGKSRCGCGWGFTSQRLWDANSVVEESAGGRGWEVNVMRGLWAGFQIWVEGCVNQIWEIIMDDFASGTMAVLSQRCSRRYSFFRSL